MANNNAGKASRGKASRSTASRNKKSNPAVQSPRGTDNKPEAGPSFQKTTGFTSTIAVSTALR